MKKLLIVTHIPFWQEDLGSKARLAELYNNLSKYFDITVFFLGSIDEFQSVNSRKFNIRIVFVSEIEPESDFNKASSKLYWERPNQNHLARFRAFTKEEFFHIELYEYIQFAHYAEVSHNSVYAIQILDTHDLMSSRAATFNRFNKTHHTNLSRFDEYSIINYFDIVITIQLEDYQYLSKSMGSEKVFYFPHVIEKDQLSHSFDKKLNSPPTSSRILFVGGGDIPNKDGIEWFIHEVWPLIQNNGCCLDIYGTVCGLFPDNPFPDDVNLHGGVEANILHQAISNACICINPVFFGSGLKIKTIEYLSFGAPTVATREAVRGMPFDDEPPIEIATTRMEFAEKVNSLLNSPARQQELAISSIYYIEKNFSRSSIEPVIEALAELVDTIPAVAVDKS